MKNFLEILREKAKRGETLAVLAPMAEVTDFVFRKIIAKYSKSNSGPRSGGGPHIFWTEFTSADGLLHPKDYQRLSINLKFQTRKERPILAQIFGSQVQNLEKAIEIIYQLRFDGVDLNFGCPDKNIEKQFCGSAMIRNQDLAEEILQAAKAKVLELNKRGKRFFSFSVKTRLGYNQITYQTWFPKILKFEPDILTVHLRTRKEMSSVKAHWEIAKEVVTFIRDYARKNSLRTPFIILNGDVPNLLEARAKIKETGCEAVMIGRGVFGTPWLFNLKEYLKRQELNLKTKEGRENILFRINLLLEHSQEFESGLKKYKSFDKVMKKHFSAYLSGFKGAKELRNSLLRARNFKEVKKISDLFIQEKILKMESKTDLC